ncbi:hypothetical protein HOG48_01175 [Candidatus Peregrinibacteria bacterium]|jgi:hypothetical protein|nr:hypothetical protein [Candidatus Peregrinibacteria bacterium]
MKVASEPKEMWRDLEITPATLNDVLAELLTDDVLTAQQVGKIRMKALKNDKIKATELLKQILTTKATRESKEREDAKQVQIEKDKSHATEVATTLAEAITCFAGESDWTGNEPLEIKVTDAKTETAYIYEIRKGNDETGKWITIQEKLSSNPGLVRTFLLTKEKDIWKYEDPCLIKYGESSLHLLEEASQKIMLVFRTLAITVIATRQQLGMELLASMFDEEQDSNIPVPTGFELTVKEC